jgi:phosphoribosylformylglycinamidine cyclo-ligase
MCANDVVCTGAEPLFFLDYISVAELVPEDVAAIVAGVAEGCRRADCVLLGGETAEHPGIMAPDEYDLAGAGVGIVEADDVLGAERVREGDAVIAMASSGLHSNGYALVRHVLLQAARLRLDAEIDELGDAGTVGTLGEALLTPTRIYARDCLALIAECEVHALAHVTGGGLAANVSRVLPPQLDAVLDRFSWAPPPIFRLIAERGRVSGEEMERTFNMGVGMVALVAAAEVERALAVLTARHVPAWVAGTVQRAEGAGSARLVGSYR